MASPVVATPVPPGAVPSSVTTNSSDSSHTDGATSSNNNARSDTPPAEQHYSLKWNDYSLKLVTAFQNLRDEEDFVDVTVACDGHQYSAHKMVLSACSPYFRSMLKANPCQHPIVILKDVGHLELERLLEFMYNGEVNIAQDQLAAFLRTAENLKIRGLAGSSDDMEQMCNTSISNDKKDNSLKDDDDSDVLNEGYSSATKKRKLMSLDEQGNNKSNMKHEPCEGSENLCDVYGNDAQEQMMAAELYTAGVRGGGDDGNSSADTSGQHNEEGAVAGCEALNLSVRPDLNNHRHHHQPPRLHHHRLELVTPSHEQTSPAHSVRVHQYLTSNNYAEHHTQYHLVNSSNHHQGGRGEHVRVVNHDYHHVRGGGGGVHHTTQFSRSNNSQHHRHHTTNHLQVMTIERNDQPGNSHFHRQYNHHKSSTSSSHYPPALHSNNSSSSSSNSSSLSSHRNVLPSVPPSSSTTVGGVLTQRLFIDPEIQQSAPHDDQQHAMIYRVKQELPEMLEEEEEQEAMDLPPKLEQVYPGEDEMQQEQALRQDEMMEEEGRRKGGEDGVRGRIIVADHRYLTSSGAELRRMEVCRGDEPDDDELMDADGGVRLLRDAIVQHNCTVDSSASTDCKPILSSAMSSTISSILTAEIMEHQQKDPLVKMTSAGYTTDSRTSAANRPNENNTNGASPTTTVNAPSNTSGKVYPCSECQKVFRHPMSLHHHRHVHRGTYTCHSCNKVFSRRWDLHRHLHRSKLGCRRPGSAATAPPSLSSAGLSSQQSSVGRYNHQLQCSGSARVETTRSVLVNSTKTSAPSSAHVSDNVRQLTFTNATTNSSSIARSESMVNNNSSNIKNSADVAQSPRQKLQLRHERQQQQLLLQQQHRTYVLDKNFSRVSVNGDEYSNDSEDGRASSTGSNSNNSFNADVLTTTRVKISKNITPAASTTTAASACSSVTNSAGQTTAGTMITTTDTQTADHQHHYSSANNLNKISSSALLTDPSN